MFRAGVGWTAVNRSIPWWRGKGVAKNVGQSVTDAERSETSVLLDD